LVKAELGEMLQDSVILVAKQPTDRNVGMVLAPKQNSKI